MTQPLRRPMQRDDHIEHLVAHWAPHVKRFDAGKGIIVAEMRDAGWPARSPEGDRKPGNGDTEPSSLDYNDPTGDLALRFEQLAGDLDAIHEWEHVLRDAFRALDKLTRRRVPLSAPAVPACDVTTCDNPVEQTGNGGYRGCERIEGVWFAKPGVKPTCARHRKLSERGAA
jgi:hypothetical protein